MPELAVGQLVTTTYPYGIPFGIVTKIENGILRAETLSGIGWEENRVEYFKPFEFADLHQLYITAVGATKSEQVFVARTRNLEALLTELTLAILMLRHPDALRSILP